MSVRQTENLVIESISSEKCSKTHVCEGYRTLYILHLCICGKGYYEVDGKKYEIGAGQSFIIYPNTKIKYYPDKDNPWEYAWVNFRGNFCEGLLESTAFSDGAFITPPLCLDEILPLYKKGQDDYESLNAHLVKADFFNILAFYTRNFPSKKTEREYTTFTHVKNFIDGNYFVQELNVEYIAQKLRMHRSQIYRIVKSNLNCSVKEYLDFKRIKEAKSLLKRHDLSVKQVAFLVGYSNQYHFSNAFKKREGLSPLAFKKQKDWSMTD